MKKFKINLTAQYVILVCALLLVINVIFGAVMINISSNSMKTLINWHMLSVANTAAAQIDGDMLESISAEDVGTDEFKQIADTLSNILNVQQDSDIKYIYATKKEGDHFVFTVDPDPVAPGAYGEQVVYTPTQDKAWEGVAAVDQATFEDKWGRFYTAWSPVRNSSGKVIGLIGVDFFPEWYDEQVLKHTVLVIVFTSLSVIVGALIMLLQTGQLKRRIRTLNSELSLLSSDVEKLSYEISLGRGPEKAHGEIPSLNAGADNIEILGNKIRVMQKQLREYMEYLNERAYTDPMTGVGNKTAYLEYIKDITRQINEGVASFAVVVFDINSLKNTNDNYGHECGDRIICDAAACIKKVFEGNAIFRIGGDEFIAILGAITEEELKTKFVDLDAEVEDFNLNRKRYAMSLSFSRGGAIYHPGRDYDYKEVFKRADEAMYVNKSFYYRQLGHCDRFHQDLN